MLAGQELSNEVKKLKDADYEKISELEKQYKKFKQFNDPRFGDV